MNAETTPESKQRLVLMARAAVFLAGLVLFSWVGRYLFSDALAPWAAATLGGALLFACELALFGLALYRWLARQLASLPPRLRQAMATALALALLAYPALASIPILHAYRVSNGPDHLPWLLFLSLVLWWLSILGLFFVLLGAWRLGPGKRAGASVRAAAGAGLMAVGLALLVSAAAAALLGQYYQAQTQGYARNFEERANLMLDVLEVSVRAHVRNQKYHPDELQRIFERVATGPLAQRLELTAGDDQEPVVAVHSTETTAQGGPPAASVARTREVDMHPLAGRGPGFGRGPGHRRGPGWRGPSEQAGWRTLPPPPYRLRIHLNAKRLEERTGNTRLEVMVLSAIVFAGMLLGFQALLARQRRRALETRLAVAQERAAHHKRLAQLGAGFAHETKNPLGLVRGFAQSIENAEGIPPESRAHARHIIDEADQLVGQINGFLSFAKPMEPELAEVDLDTLFAGLTALVRQEAGEAGVRLEHDGGGLHAQADENMLRRALLNLVINALRACGQGDTVSLWALTEGGRIAVAVADTGAGIAPADMDRVREPYFTRFPGGTGLGLAIVEQVARAHGWGLTIDSAEGQGTVVRLSGLPPAEEHYA